jgi:hypothetical protein
MIARREVLIGAAAALALPGAAAASAGARQLALWRAGDRIGGKTVTVHRVGDEVEVETRIDIVVKILGITAYRYALAARETWVRGELQRLRAETNDNGTAHFANADRSGGRLTVQGSVYAGPVDGSAATTSYWSPAFLGRGVWISTQDGRLFDVRATDLGSTSFPTAGGSVEARRWRISGDLTDLFLYYDAADEWVGTEFPARGETARFVVTAKGPALTPLWVEP